MTHPSKCSMDMEIDMENKLVPELCRLLDRGREGRVCIITGAGMSAESGIPTFRGEEGYWVVGSREYRPQEMATRVAFTNMPREVWRWYLYRRHICRAAGPNPGHVALARLEQALGDRFSLVTQNVDGIHLRAGNTLERTYQVHGNIDFMRAANDGVSNLIPMDPELVLDKLAPMTDEMWARLVCPDGQRARPHILWFDEYYNEMLYRSTTAMTAAASCDLLLIIGTSGAASLPMHATAEAARAGAAIVNLDPYDNDFAVFARDSSRGHWVQGKSAIELPAIVDYLIKT